MRFLTAWCLACSQTGQTQSTPSDAGVVESATDDHHPPSFSDGGSQEGCTLDAGTAAATLRRVLIKASPEKLPVRVDHHATLIVETKAGPFLYVFGGATDAFTAMSDAVYRARIADDGSLGSFSVVSKMPGPRSGHALAFHHGIVFLAGGTRGLGGHHGSSLTAGSIFASIDADTGDLGAWKEGPSMPLALMHATATVVRDFVYVVGGVVSNPETQVLRTRIVDGEVEPYVVLHELPSPRSHHTAFAWGDSLYLVGGLDKDPTKSPPSLSDVVRAPVSCDGALGPFVSAGTLPGGMSVQGVLVHDGAVYLGGGLYRSVSRFSDRIFRGVMDSEGSLANVETLPATFSIPRGHVHQLPTYGGRFYSVAGRIDDGSSTDVVDIGRFE